MALGAQLHPFARPAATPESFIRIVRGEGAWVWDDAGTEYVDGLASLWYCNVGHGRPEIAEAVAAQMRLIAGYHCFEKFTNDPSDALAERIADLAPVPNSRVLFTSGGSEAVESALKTARIAQAVAGHPERTVIVSREPSYHGVGYGGTTVTGLPGNRADFGPGIGDVVRTPMHDLEAVRAVFETGAPGRVAAVIAEPVIGAGGVHPPAPGYLEGLRALCDEHGAYLICDEVICAFGRLGGWFSAERYGVRPDLITFAKAVSGGYQPLGGVVIAPSVHEVLSRDETFMFRHGFTYSGHPTACAAGLACIDILEKESLPARAPVIGARLSAGLGEMRDAGVIAEVRGDGAIWAAGLHPGDDPMAIRDDMLRRGVIVRPIAPSTLAICPPLVISDGDVDRIVATLADSVRAVAGR